MPSASFRGPVRVFKLPIKLFPKNPIARSRHLPRVPTPSPPIAVIHRHSRLHRCRSAIVCARGRATRTTVSADSLPSSLLAHLSPSPVFLEDCEAVRLSLSHPYYRRDVFTDISRPARNGLYAKLRRAVDIDSLGGASPSVVHSPASRSSHRRNDDTIVRRL